MAAGEHRARPRRVRERGGTAVVVTVGRAVRGEEEDFPLSAVCPQSMPYSRVLEVYREHLSCELVYFPDPLLLHQGHMQWLFDHEGNRYLDFFSGIVTVSVGHCHP